MVRPVREPNRTLRTFAETSRCILEAAGLTGGSVMQRVR
jgi:hypothetical protein